MKGLYIKKKKLALELNGRKKGKSLISPSKKKCFETILFFLSLMLQHKL